MAEELELTRIRRVLEKLVRLIEAQLSAAERQRLVELEKQKTEA